MKILNKVILFFRVTALCKFVHRKLDISKIITARSFNFGQLIDAQGRTNKFEFGVTVFEAHNLYASTVGGKRGVIW